MKRSINFWWHFQMNSYFLYCFIHAFSKKKTHPSIFFQNPFLRLFISLFPFPKERRMYFLSYFRDWRCCAFISLACHRWKSVSFCAIFLSFPHKFAAFLSFPCRLFHHLISHFHIEFLLWILISEFLFDFCSEFRISILSKFTFFS